MQKKDFYFDLDEKFIAQEPLKERTDSKLLVVDKKTESFDHNTFKNIIDYLNKGDCLVLNNSRVIPARLIGERKETKAKVELLLLKRIDIDQWEVMVKPGKKAKIGNVISFGDGLLEATVLEIVEGGNRIVSFEYQGIFEEVLDSLGQMPLPPYITHHLEDRERYQTVYSDIEGSAAAPTAGLHFTNELLATIENKGISIVYVTLHVGLGTFRPVKEANINDHVMHSEYYTISEEAAEKINAAKENGGKVIAVGTTSSRTLESVADEVGHVDPKSGWTDIFIYPGYKFKIVDALITNFHLPESTLIMLVSALASRELILQAYEEAKKNEYRFFSFGDAMLIK